MQFSKITLSLLLALPTAFAYSLGDKESLNKNEVTLGCLNTYSREVTECSDAEISSGSCSSDCKAALDTLGKDVMLACRQAYAGPDTLLRKILDGGLTITLCKTTTDNKDDEEEKKETEEPEETDETDETSNTTELVIDNSPTITITTPEETSSAVTETVTSDVEEPTGSTNTDTTESTGGSDTENSTETSTETSTDTESATTTETGSPDETILGDDDNAAGKVGAGMSIIIGAAIVGFVSML